MFERVPALRSAERGDTRAARASLGAAREVQPRVRRTPHLVLGSQRDPAERQADLVAAAVVHGSAPALAKVAPTATKVRRSTGGAEASASRGDAELDASTSDRIQAARRGGAALAHRERRLFEPTLRRSLSDVRLHAGAESRRLNDQVGSVAFTVGNDVFFRDGRPDVSTPRGRGLLAHELTHTVQQAGQTDGSKVVRRAVGFEFECSALVIDKLARPLTKDERKGKAVIPAEAVNTPKVITRYRDVELTADSGSNGSTHVEWVLDPVPETDDGRALLALMMGFIVEVTERLGQASRDARLSYASPHTERVEPRFFASQAAMKGFSLPNDLMVFPTQDLVADPQMTAGIRLSQLADVMTKMTTQRLGDESDEAFAERKFGRDWMTAKGDTDLVGMSPAAVKATFASFVHAGKGAPKKPSAQLVGMLALMRTYLIGGTSTKTYAKGMMPLLAKTDFARQFEMLPEAEYYRANPKDWRALVLACAGMSGTGSVPVFEADVLYALDPEGGPGEMPRLRTITRQLWLDGILHGKDRLSTAGARPRMGRAAAKHMFGFGSLGRRTDTVGKAGKQTDKSTILEFRRMGNQLPPHQWTAFALELFDYVRAVNEMKKPTYKGNARR